MLPSLLLSPRRLSETQLARVGAIHESNSQQHQALRNVHLTRHLSPGAFGAKLGGILSQTANKERIAVLEKELLMLAHCNLGL